MDLLATLFHPPLFELNLWMDTLHSGIVQQLCNVPWLCPTLRILTLGLSDNNVDTKSGLLLARALGGLKGLTFLRLDLSYNHLGNEGALGLMQMAVDHANLRTLMLSAENNGLTLAGREAATELAQELLNRGLVETHSYHRYLEMGHPWEELYILYGPWPSNTWLLQHAGPE